MSTMGTFDAFTSARLGIYAAQHGFRVTGNNISNINTVGYTRQRLDQVSFKAGAYDRYRSQLDNHVGSGALVMNINQVRDPTLDVRYRDTNASFGYNNEMLDGLEKIASILDEVGVGDDTNVNKKGDGRLHAQIQAVSEALRAYSKNPTKDNDNLVRNAASTLCEILNTYARELETLRVETEQKFKDQVTEINECLTNIRDLNEEIRDNEIFGDNALELRDERNRQIDKLSEYLHIKVVYSEEDVGAGKKVEKLSIYLDNDNPTPGVHTDEAMLIDGIFGAQISSPEVLPAANPAFDPSATGHTLGSYRYLKQKMENGVPVYIVNSEEVAIADPADVPEGAIPAVDPTDVDSGTNDPKLAAQIPNNYYGLQISELKDQRDRLWEDFYTTWEDITVETPSNATYEIPISNNLVEGDTFEVAGKTFYVGTPPAGTTYDYTVTPDEVKDADVFAGKVADALNTNPDKEYTAAVKGDGSGTITFTAKNQGKVGSTVDGTTDQPPQAPPSLTVINGNGKITVGTRTCTDPGVKYEADPNEMDNPAAHDFDKNLNGSETSVSYRENNGRWWRVTTDKFNTYPLTLDDNDTYGSLQATRELLTEAGEFTTKYVNDNIDENASKKHGIPFYQYSLDLFARQFATEYNKLNQGVAVDQNGNVIYKDQTGTVDDLGLKKSENPNYSDYYVDKSGYFVGKHASTDPNNPVECLLTKAQIKDTDTIAEAAEKIQKYVPEFVDGWPKKDILTSDTATPEEKAAAQKELVKDFMDAHAVTDATIPAAPNNEITVKAPIFMGGVLFSNRNDGDLTDNPPINASNITISHSWSTGDVELVPKFEILWDGDIDHSSQNTNADHMVTMLDKDHIINFYPKDIVPDAVGTPDSKLFSGSFGEMFNDMCTTLGEDRRKINVNLNMYYTQVVEIDTARDGVSGVDLNDEAMNLMQFQKAYSAACRLMTVVDESLDRLINNTGIAGR